MTQRTFRVHLAAGSALLVLLGGCASKRSSATSVADRVGGRADAQPVARSAEHQSPDAFDVDANTVPTPSIATINGLPLERSAFISLLMESHGLPLLQRLMTLELARQEARRVGVRLGPDDISAEYDRTLRAGLAGATADGAWTPAQRERFIEELTRLRGWSRQELDFVMERQAILRKIAAGSVILTDDQLQIEYHRRYGEKVEVRHIQLSAARFCPQVSQRLDQGETFAALARELSQNYVTRETDGLMPPFTAADPDIPGALRAAAFELEPGQVSNPIQFEGAFHILALERRIPADDTAFVDVLDELRESLRRRLIERHMARLGARLLNECALTIQDPLLRKAYRQRRGAGRIAGPALTR